MNYGSSALFNSWDNIIDNEILIKQLCVVDPGHKA